MRDIIIGDWTKLGSTIKTERTRAGLSQHDLAARAGISRSWIARVEAGHRGAGFEQLLRLLEALDMSMILRSADASEKQPDEDSLDAAMLVLMDERRAGTTLRRRAWSSAGNDGQRPT